MANFRSSRSHKHQKLNRYTGDVSSRRRHRGFQLWWIIPISGAVAFLLAILLGNCLGAKVPESGNESSTPDTSESTLKAPPVTVDVGEVDAVFVGLEGIYDNTYSEVSRQIPDGARAISFSMFLSNGAPLYRSEVAIACGKPSGELTLGNIFRYPNENDIYVSVPFQSAELVSEEGASSHIKAAYEISLIKELSEAGADEIIIRCKPFGAQSAELLRTDEYMDRITDYLSDLRHEIPDIKIGFMISGHDAADQSLAAMIDKLSKNADFIAVDMTSATDPVTLEEAVTAAITNLLRYKMRVLVGGTGEELYSVLDSMSIKNRQTVKR